MYNKALAVHTCNNASNIPIVLALSTFVCACDLLDHDTYSSLKLAELYSTG